MPESPAALTGKRIRRALIEQHGLSETWADGRTKPWLRLMWEVYLRCHWCGIVTTWGSEEGDARPADSRLSPDVATKDHVVSRNEKPRSREEFAQWVLACYACNRQRNDDEQRRTRGRIALP